MKQITENRWIIEQTPEEKETGEFCDTAVEVLPNKDLYIGCVDEYEGLDLTVREQILLRDFLLKLYPLE
ncbi:hypothetical protein HYQ09_gp126 [Acinetobacter phage vB_AbaM_Konradin]|uniref:Uncharacterized protein n=2 Tax=Lazarusvirus TaxID=2842820 RepID=A0A650EV64_9CAUD|nr:hypothetical protein HYQ09_gp126 [Acinetobacter phage vB_AbaM_Konradin]YP_009886401.1 hypothetical protein HYQ21_gp124 [Acinetobacter phage vB_AbaM_Apostate]QGT53890.1 hypothetical protein Konradin_127 [Acinetobacter phage vB_AbaM_Konradin]QGZ15715.1 hypothetical protein Apostate_124 [Acinetobacter phage vB_AbaM_Apostate]